MELAIVKNWDRIDCRLICLKKLRNITVDWFSETNHRSEIKTRIFRIRRWYATNGPPHGEIRLSNTGSLFESTDSERLTSQWGNFNRHSSN
jgi:hypothetical protein